MQRASDQSGQSQLNLIRLFLPKTPFGRFPKEQCFILGIYGGDLLPSTHLWYSLTFAHARTVIFFVQIRHRAILQFRWSFNYLTGKHLFYFFPRLYTYICFWYSTCHAYTYIYHIHTIIYEKAKKPRVFLSLFRVNHYTPFECKLKDESFFFLSFFILYPYSSSLTWIRMYARRFSFCTTFTLLYVRFAKNASMKTSFPIGVLCGTLKKN